MTVLKYEFNNEAKRVSLIAELGNIKTPGLTFHYEGKAVTIAFHRNNDDLQNEMCQIM